MSRSGYRDDLDNWSLIKWRGRVTSATRGKRGQSLLKAIAQALDEMPVKELFPNNFATAAGEFCTLGVLGHKRGLDMSGFGDADDGCDRESIAAAFDVALPLVAEIMFENDDGLVDDFIYKEVEICGPMRPWRHESHRRPVWDPNPHAPAQRWQHMRAWVARNIKTEQGG